MTNLYVGVALLVFVGELGAQTGVVAGRVLDAKSERPLAGAVVEVPLLRRTVTTDSSGSFRLTALADGEHLLRIRAIGFSPTTVAVRLAPGDSLAADFLLGANCEK